jgi:hypothetical protein
MASPCTAHTPKRAAEQVLQDTQQTTIRQLATLIRTSSHMIPLAKHARSLFLFLTIATAAQAWSGGGHKTLASIAYERLPPAVRSKVAALLEHHPRYKEDFLSEMPADLQSGPAADREHWLFCQAAIWPDKPRAYDIATMGALRDQYHRGSWHYINTPIFLDQASKTALESKLDINLSPAWKPGTSEKNLNALQLLTLAATSIKDPTLPDDRKALLLSWIFHVVGDLHQPLHCVALFGIPALTDLSEGDRGGNRIFWPDNGPFKRMTLHAYWDLLMRSNMDEKQAHIQALKLLKDSTLQAQAQAALSVPYPAKWVEEGTALANTAVYSPEILDQVKNQKADQNGDVQIQAPSTDYKNKATSLAHQRLLIGGYRLGQLLERLFGT